MPPYLLPPQLEQSGLRKQLQEKRLCMQELAQVPPPPRFPQHGVVLCCTARHGVPLYGVALYGVALYVYYAMALCIG